MKNYSLNTLFSAVISAALLGASYCATGATTDISSSPLASSSSTAVKPNIYFILDDSGSMGWEYLPDTVDNNNSKYCYRNYAYNLIYYNPNYTYTPPVYADGTSYPNASYNNAKSNGFDAASSSVNLQNGFKAGNDSSGQQAYYYKHTSTPNGTCEANSKYALVQVPSTSSEAQNFANWYSYYRTRIMLMQTAAGKAFKSITSGYRVGFSTIGYTGTDSTVNEFLKINDFDATQKSLFYSKLYTSTAGGSTPLRAALSKAGRMYAGQLLTGSDDPVKYSCQQNFTILSTDGYWNTGLENPANPTGDGCKTNSAASTNYGAYGVDNQTCVGNMDGGTTAKPLYDANAKSNTLADVAMYYYQTDLRTSTLGNCTGALGSGTDVCENNVPGAGADINTQQHMTTFTLGLGLDGLLNYTEDYLSGGSTDYEALKQGTKKWPDPIANSNAERIDDLWHAAVNGRGIYFSAKNPDSLISGLSKALAGVSARTGSAAAAATSNLEPVAGDNFVYIALYRTVNWDGDLQAKTIDPSTGAISATPVWTTQAQLDAKVTGTTDTRTIYTFDSGTSNKLKSFDWASLTATEQGYFNNICPSAKLSQCSSLTAAQQTAASGVNLVKFIRGQDGYEDQASNTDRIYRDRAHVLGDMISSQPVYVKTPPFAYVDANYDTFRDSTQKNRAAMVYVAVNDGMLHAFNGTTGVEEWAYIPQLLMPNLYKLADKNYSTNHQYYVDGSPSIGDICPTAPASTCTGAQWKTILVGGFNAGGRGYYALDVTNPASPKALWNFTLNDDNDLGLTYGNPIITKRKDGTWIVVVTSGYNNISPGSGIGYLYVLNANTGAVLEKISTGAGSTTTPSGLGKINAWINTTTDNTAQRFYGGDLEGNVWRFDIDDVVPPAGKEAVKVGIAGQINGAGTQSITTKPELTEVTYGSSNYAVVNIGTGRYLGVNDLSDTSQQSVYAFKDDLTATGLGQLRATGLLVKQTLTTFTGSSGELLRKSSTNAVDWSTKSGWYVDLNPNSESPGERVNVDMQMQLGLLTVAGNVPNANACNLGGYAWLYYFDYRTGQYVKTASDNMVGRRLTNNALVAGLKTIKLTTGKTLTIITDTGGGITGNDDPTSSGGGASGGKRVSWRELLN
ncbi:MAG TPA: PilC/PilY family type IV pilus protein [Gallionellaceae bacterium]|nr:PilC/PilY family type IV pilus protein [Gallionellaceae bacterium]